MLPLDPITSQQTSGRILYVQSFWCHEMRLLSSSDIQVHIWKWIPLREILEIGGKSREVFPCPSSSPSEKAMTPHSSTLAWQIPWMEEPGRLQSMGSRRVGHDWATSLSLFTLMHWKRKWQPTPVFLPGESQGRGSLVGCRLWGRIESDTTEAT